MALASPSVKATAPVVRARAEQVTVAVSTVVVFGSPPARRWLLA